MLLIEPAPNRRNARATTIPIATSGRRMWRAPITKPSTRSRRCVASAIRETEAITRRSYGCGPVLRHALTILAGDDPKVVMLNLMQPLAAGRQLVGFGWEARRDEAGREGAHTQHNA